MDRLLKEAVRRFFRSLGFDVKCRSPKHSAELRRALILVHNDITLVLDVGANVGEYALELRRSGW